MFSRKETLQHTAFWTQLWTTRINLEAGTIKQWPQQFLRFKCGILCHHQVEKRQFLIKWCHFCFKCLIHFQSTCRKLVSSHCWSSDVINQAVSPLNSYPNIRYAALASREECTLECTRQHYHRIKQCVGHSAERRRIIPISLFYLYPFCSDGGFVWVMQMI